MNLNIRTLYLYLFSFVGLLIIVFGSISLINIALKTYVFKEADKFEIYLGETKPTGEVMSKEELEERQEKELNRQRQRELSNAVAMLMVGTPLYLYHWKTLQKENKKNK